MSPFGFHITQNEEQEVAARSASAQCLTLINSNSRNLKYTQVLSIYCIWPAVSRYSSVHKCWRKTSWAGNQGNHQNFDPSLLFTQEILTAFRGDEAKFFFETNFQNGRLKKTEFSKPSILNIFSRKFQGLVLGSVE